MTRAAIVLALAVAACQGGADPEPEPPPVSVRCVAARRASVQEKVSLRGRVEPPPGGDLPVAAQVPGRIVSVAVHEGQRLGRGDVVATVDDATVREGAHRADAARAQARGELTNAEVTLTRARELVRRGIAAQQELDDATAREQAARANLAAATAGVDLARRTLGRVEVRSSFAGVVTRVWRGPGALVDGTAATPIVELATLDASDFVAEATEGELAHIRAGQTATGTLIDGATFVGTVGALANALDPSTGLGTVRVAMAEVSGPITLGAFGRIDIMVARRDGVLVLPVAALRGAIADGAEVALCQHGHTALRNLVVGWRDGSQFEPVRGLAPGDRVAIDHVLGLVDGTPIAEVK